MTAMLQEAAREIPVIAESDVLVVGGGAAGMAAACAAARAGASTLLIERQGFLGGTLTAVTLGGFCGTHMVVDEARLARVVGGFYLDIEQRLAARHAILPPKRHGKIVGTPYESASLKIVADEIAAAPGVNLLFHTYAVAVDYHDRRIGAIIVENKGGRAAIRAGVVIDCSGDGDVAARAGADFTLGDHGVTQYGSAMFKLGGVDIAVAEKLSRADIREHLEAAVAVGYPLPRTATGVHINPLEGVVHLNVTRLGDEAGRPFNMVDPGQLSRAEIIGRRQVYMYEEVFQKFVPGFAKSRVIDIGTTVGVRETRLIAGEQTLTVEMVKGCVKPADRIACSAWPLEAHGEGRGTVWEFLPDAEHYGIPYGCLVAKGFDNLLVAGRNLSATHLAQASVRVAGPCFAMGEAAGVAAVLATRAHIAARDVAVGEIQQQLLEHGAILTPRIE